MVRGAEIIHEIPSSNPRMHYYPKECCHGGGDGLMVCFHPRLGSEWIGVFKFGYPSGHTISGIFDWAGSNKILVISRGQGHIIDIDSPELFEPLTLFPVTFVVPTKGKDIIIICDYVKMAAYSSAGLVWQTCRISWDGFKSVIVLSERIMVEAWDAVSDRWVPLFIDIGTGAVEQNSIISKDFIERLNRAGPHA